MGKVYESKVEYTIGRYSSVSVKDSLDSQLEDTKLFTVTRTYVTLNWVDRKTAFTVSQDKESLQLINPSTWPLYLEATYYLKIRRYILSLK